MQLYQPLGFFGFVYRALKQSLIDIENMLELLDVPQDVDDVPDAPAFVLSGGEVHFSNVSFAYDPA